MAALRPLLLCVSVCFHILTTRAVPEFHCAAYEKEETETTGLQFVTQALMPTIITCDDEHTELWCCTLGYTELVWQKLVSSSGNWNTVTLDKRTYTKEHNQTLVMNYAMKNNDETKYRCTARNASRYEISYTMDLVVKARQMWDDPPIAVQPAPDLQLLRLPGANITLPCRGVFGPDYETERGPANLTWRRDTLAPDGTVTSSSTWVAGVDNGTDDGHISISFREGEQTMTSHLHVMSIGAEDYGNYTCTMTDTRGSVRRVVRLMRRELLKFLPEPRSIAITCLEQQIELSCYVRHYKTLLWFHYDNASQIWEEVKLSSHVYPSPEGDNRTLVLERPALSDGGWYRCTAEDGRGHKISHNISLIIQGCGAQNNAPVASLEPNGVLKRQTGSDVSLNCSAYFGPNYENDLFAVIVWIRETQWENGSLALRDAWVATYRDYGHNMPSDPRLQLSFNGGFDSQNSVLTIHNLSSSDYGNYSCFARNSVGKSEVITAILLPEDPSQQRETPDQLGPEVALILGVIVGVVICASSLGLIFNKDIRLLYKEKISKPRNPDAIYDALVIFNEDHSPDCQFVVRTLLPVLEEKYGYQLCIAMRDFIAGPDLGDVIVDNIEASQAIVFVVTEAMLQQEWCDFVFQYVAAREYTNLVFIMCEPIRDQAWHTNQGPLKNVIGTSKNVITWPRDSKKKDRFWKDLRLSLPAKLQPHQTQSDAPSHALLHV